MIYASVFRRFFMFLLVLHLYLPQASAQGKKVAVTTQQSQIPVLKYKRNNPVLTIRIKVTQTSTLRALRVSTKGTTRLEDIDTVRLFYTGSDSLFSEQQPYGTAVSPDQSLRFKQQLPLDTGTHYFWVAYQVSDQADLLHFVDATFTEATFQNGNVKSTSSNPNHLKLGVALRQHNQDSVHTYRIPGLTTSRSGTLLSAYDARWNSSSDLQGDIDIGLNKSTDGGNTWGPLQVVLDQNEWGGLPEKFNGVSDPSILADTLRGIIYVAGLWMHGVLDKQGQWMTGLTEQSDAWEHQWVDRGSQPGFEVKQTSQFLLTKSADDGLTWSEPINLTEMGKEEEWWLWAPAPGRGIVLEDGTLVFPTQGRDATGEPFSTITYSRDQGQTWDTGQPAYTNTTECAVVQLSDDRLMLNMRDNRNREDKSATNGRAVFTTNDLGQTCSSILRTTEHCRSLPAWPACTSTPTPEAARAFCCFPTLIPSSSAITSP